MTSTITPETSNIWIKNRTWREPEMRLDLKVSYTAYGTPQDPADAGRLAVDAHAEDLRKLADS